MSMASHEGLWNEARIKEEQRTQQRSEASAVHGAHLAPVPVAFQKQPISSRTV